MSDTTDIRIRFIDGREITIKGVADWTMDYKNLFLRVKVLDDHSQERTLFFNLHQIECVGDEEVQSQSYQSRVWR
ncbi:MAG: hypothetical protein LUF68_01895 [Clostridiales bacterium]|nr:hypothetical protein [Clostridiales bacterium]